MINEEQRAKKEQQRQLQLTCGTTARANITNKQNEQSSSKLEKSNDCTQGAES